MEFDKETLEKIIETHNNVGHILKKLDNIDLRCVQHETRIRDLEENQTEIKTKLALIAGGIGFLASTIANAVIWIFDR